MRKRRGPKFALIPADMCKVSVYSKRLIADLMDEESKRQERSASAMWVIAAREYLNARGRLPKGSSIPVATPS